MACRWIQKLMFGRSGGLIVERQSPGLPAERGHAGSPGRGPVSALQQDAEQRARRRGLC